MVKAVRRVWPECNPGRVVGRLLKGLIQDRSRERQGWTVGGGSDLRRPGPGRPDARVSAICQLEPIVRLGDQATLLAKPADAQ